MNATITSLQRPADAEPLRGLRVLFLPKNSRTPYFSSLLEKGHRDLSWTITVVGPHGTERVWSAVTGTGGGFIATPDFNEPQPFEKDAAASAALDAFITACERKTGVSASRIILAGERDIGRGFSRPVFYWFHDKTARRALADTAEPMRVVRRIFAFAKSALETARPDIVMTGEWANPVCFAIYMAARQMGIPCVVNRLSKLWSGRCYWSPSLMMWNDLSIAAADARRSAGTPPSARALEKLDTFRDRPSTLGYVQQNWNALDKRGGRGSHADIARVFAAGVRHRIFGGPAAKPAMRLFFDIYRKKWLRMRQKQFFRRYSDEQLRDTPYVLLALHKDPELTLNFQAYVWASQYNTISTLCGTLPDGYKLLVREHRSNTGRRPTQYYKDLATMPGLVFIDAFDDQFKYIRNADLVVTDNGSVGWEAMQLSRPVITLADSYYDGAALARRVRVHDQLAEHVLELATDASGDDEPARRQALGAALDAEWDCSVPLETADHTETLALLARLYPDIRTEAGAMPAVKTA